MNCFRGGTNFYGGLDPRFPPDFVLNNPAFHAKDDYARVIRNKQAEQGLRQLANYELWLKMMPFM